MMTKKALFNYFYRLCALVILVACTSCQNYVKDTKPFDVQETKALQGLIVFNVRDIKIIDNTHLLFDQNNIEDRAPLSPKKAIKDWAFANLRAGGHKNQLKFIITEATLREDRVVNNSIRRLYQPAKHQYQSQYVLQLLLVDDTEQNILGEININAHNVKIVEGSISVLEQENIFNQMIHEMLKKAVLQLKEDAAIYFKDYLLPPQ